MRSSAVTCPINQLPARHYATKGRADYFIEPKTGVIFQAVLPTVQEMEAFNQQEYQGGMYRAYFEMDHLKKRTAALRLNLIRKYGKTGGRLLDVGCSVGFFLEVAQQFGFDVHGVELSSAAIAMAHESIRERISHADANEHIRQSGTRYDVVTAYDIIEHTQDPRAFIRDLFSALGDGGVVAIATPDTDHYLRYLMGSHWSMLQPMQHTFLFSRRSIRTLLAEAGFQDIQVTPAAKTLTLSYLFGQLSQTNPALSRLYEKVVRPIMPAAIGDAPIDINIGEFFAIARKPGNLMPASPQ